MPNGTLDALQAILGSAGLGDPQQIATQQRVQQLDAEIDRVDRDPALATKTKARRIAELLDAKDSVVSGGQDATGRIGLLKQAFERRKSKIASLKRGIDQGDILVKAKRLEAAAQIAQLDREAAGFSERLSELTKQRDQGVKDRAGELEQRAKAAQQAKAAQGQGQEQGPPQAPQQPFRIQPDGSPAAIGNAPEVPNTNVGARVAAASGQAVPGPAAASQQAQAPAGGGFGGNIDVGQPPAFTVGADVSTSRELKELIPGVHTPVSSTKTSLSLRPNVLTPGGALQARIQQRQLAEQKRSNLAREGISQQGVDAQRQTADRAVQLDLFKLKFDVAKERISARSKARAFDLKSADVINDTLDNLIREKGTVSTPSGYHLALEVGKTGPVDAIDARARQTAVNVGAGKTQSRFDAGKGNAGAILNELVVPAMLNDQFVGFSREQATLLPKDQVIKEYMIATGFAQFITSDATNFGGDVRKAAQKQFKDWLLVKSFKLNKEGTGFDAIPNSGEKFAGAAADAQIRVLNKILTRFDVAPGDTSEVALARSRALTQYLRNPLASSSAFGVAAPGAGRSDITSQLQRALLEVATDRRLNKEMIQLADQLDSLLPGAIGPFQPTRRQAR